MVINNHLDGEFGFYHILPNYDYIYICKYIYIYNI
jgi:hypothetical protein